MFLLQVWACCLVGVLRSHQPHGAALKEPYLAEVCHIVNAQCLLTISINTFKKSAFFPVTKGLPPTWSYLILFTNLCDICWWQHFGHLMSILSRTWPVHTTHRGRKAEAWRDPCSDFLSHTPFPPSSPNSRRSCHSGRYGSWMYLDTSC